MLKNQKAVSRERVVGISFVDILIQAVFILFLAVTIGYTDPMKLLKIKDCCNMTDCIHVSITPSLIVIASTQNGYKDSEWNGNIKLMKVAIT